MAVKVRFRPIADIQGACQTLPMSRPFTERWFKVSSPHGGVDFVIIGRDALGWKMDVHGYEHNEWPDGDTYQDTLDEFLPFVTKYIDNASTWTVHDTGEELTMLDALMSVIGSLD